MSEFGRTRDLYFGGDLEAAIALTGQVAGRIESIEPVEIIIQRTVTEFRRCIDRLTSYR